MTKKKNRHIGSIFDNWLDKVGLREEVTVAAIKSVIAQNLSDEMKKKKLTKKRRAELLKIRQALADEVEPSFETLKSSSSPPVLRQIIGELLPQFEKDTGHRVITTYGAIGELTDHLAKGEAADVAIVSDTQIDELQKLGRIISGTRLDIAKTGVGTFVRKNSPKPDVSSVDAFRRTLLAAKTVTWSDPARGGAAGIYMTHLMERLGISAETNSKVKLDATGGLLLYQIVANGEADLGFDQISVILRQPTVELLGPLPEPIQYYTTFAAGIGAASDQAEAGQALIKFLAAPSVQARMKANGFN